MHQEEALHLQGAVLPEAVMEHLPAAEAVLLVILPVREEGHSTRRSSGYHRKKGPELQDHCHCRCSPDRIYTGISLALKGKGSNTDTAGTETVIESEAETEMQKEVQVDGISITGMSKSEAKAAILKEFPWSMTVEYESDQYQVTDLMAEKVEALLDEIYKDGSDPQESYTLDTSGLDEQGQGRGSSLRSKMGQEGKERFH